MLAILFTVQMYSSKTLILEVVENGYQMEVVNFKVVS